LRVGASVDTLTGNRTFNAVLILGVALLLHVFQAFEKQRQIYLAIWLIGNANALASSKD
jgi:hypothetical protein